MNAKDRDLKKLKNYIKGLGLKLFIKPYSRYTGAAEYVSGKAIIIFDKKTTKTDTILTLLHELGHHLDWLAQKNSKEIIIALDYLSKGPMQGKREDIPKKYRKVILQTERDGVKYMTKIHKLLNLEISIEEVIIQQYFDLFDYQFLYKYGRFPKCNEYKRRSTVRKKI